jgi:hypothetical protein
MIDENKFVRTLEKSIELCNIRDETNDTVAVQRGAEVGLMFQILYKIKSGVFAPDDIKIAIPFACPKCGSQGQPMHFIHHDDPKDHNEYLVEQFKCNHCMHNWSNKYKKVEE